MEASDKVRGAFRAHYPSGVILRQDLSFLLQRLGIGDALLEVYAEAEGARGEEIQLEDFISWLTPQPDAGQGVRASQNAAAPGDGALQKLAGGGGGDEPALLQPRDVVAFWRDAGPQKWYMKDTAFDEQFRQYCGRTHMAAAARQLDAWLEEPDGALALVILLDQFPRNAYRGTAHMFATDTLALAFAERAIAAGHDLAFELALRQFFYLPFEHVENLAAQNRAVVLMQPLGEEKVRYAVEHRDIIERFGRFPHRNFAMGRQSTQAEQEFLDGGGFAG